MSVTPKTVSVGALQIANNMPFVLIAGPCQMESRDHALECAAALHEICGELGIGLIYKSSFDKANRTSIRGPRGIGLEGALPVFAEVKEKFGCPVLTESGNDNVMLCDRGTSFGYNTLVTDFRGLPIMAETGYPVIFDATHSVQQPGGQGTSSGGQREFVPVLARAAVAVGVAGLFIETHPDPDKAPSDGPNMIALKDMPGLLAELLAYDQLTKSKLQ